MNLITARKNPLQLCKTLVVSFFLSSNIVYAQVIRDITVNDDETLLLTAQGKTARLWEIATGKVIGEFSIPEDDLSIGKDDEFGGDIYAISFYDSQVVIAGVSRGIYFFDLKSKKNTHRIESNIKYGITDICISPDKELFAVTAAFDGFLLWRVKDKELIVWDNDINDEGAFSCSISKDNYILTASTDSFLRLYDMHGDLVLKTQPLDKYLPREVRFHHASTYFAVNLVSNKNNFIAINNLDNNLNVNKEFYLEDIGEDISHFSWGYNNNYIYATEEKNNKTYIFRFRAGGEREYLDIIEGEINDIISLKNGGGVIFTVGEKWYVL